MQNEGESGYDPDARDCLILKKVDTFRNTKMSTLCIKEAKKSLLVKNGW